MTQPTAGATLTKPTTTTRDYRGIILASSDRHALSNVEQRLDALASDAGMNDVQATVLSGKLPDTIQLESHVAAMVAKAAQSWTNDIGCACTADQAQAFAVGVTASILGGPLKTILAPFSAAIWTTRVAGADGPANKLAGTS